MSWNIQAPPVPNRREYPFVGTVKAHGLTVHLENLKGSVRKGSGWETKMKYHYGEILGTRGVDRDKLDVYLGPDPKSKKVFVIHQNDPKTEKYDEDKVMLGFDSAESAKKAYLSQYDSPKFFRSMTEWKLNDFKKKIFGENRGEKVAQKPETKNGPGKAYGDDIRKMVGAKKKKPPVKKKEEKGTAYRIGEEIAKRFLSKSSTAQTEYLTKLDDPVKVPLPGTQKKPPKINSKKVKSPAPPDPPDPPNPGLPSKTASRASVLYRALQETARRQAARQAARETQLFLDQARRFATNKTTKGGLKDEIRDTVGLRKQERPVRVEVPVEDVPKTSRK